MGYATRIPLIIGSNKDEASTFKFMKYPLMPVSAQSVEAMLQLLADDHPGISATKLAEIMSAYPDHAKPSGALALSRDAAFRMPTLWIADAHCRHSPTWVYRFDHATPMLKAARIGAGHATELPYVFGNFGTLNVDPTFWLGGRKAAMEVAGRIQRRWLAFARHAVPAALDGSKHWAPYEEEKRSTLWNAPTAPPASDPPPGPPEQPPLNAPPVGNNPGQWPGTVRWPYGGGLATLEEGPRVVSNLLNCPRSEVRIGMRLALVFQEIAPGLALPQPEARRSRLPTGSRYRFSRPSGYSMVTTWPGLRVRTRSAPAALRAASRAAASAALPR